MQRSKQEVTIVIYLCEDEGGVTIYNGDLNNLRMSERVEKNRMFPLRKFHKASHVYFERSMAYTVCHTPRKL